MSDILIFDRSVKKLHRARAQKHLANHDVLLHEVAARMIDRFDIVQKNFTTILDLSAHTNITAPLLTQRFPHAQITQADFSDTEILSAKLASFDLAISLLNLHWINDLPGALIQIRQALKPDSMFIATLLGGATLQELRESYIAAESALSNKIGPRISPFADVRDMAALLQRAGFELPVADTERLTLYYKHPYDLMRELRGLGETNALLKRQKNFTTRRAMEAIAHTYKERFSTKDGIPATFDIITITGWTKA